MNFAEWKSIWLAFMTLFCDMANPVGNDQGDNHRRFLPEVGLLAEALPRFGSRRMAKSH
jgi:hypothetical protein